MSKRKRLPVPTSPAELQEQMLASLLPYLPADKVELLTAELNRDLPPAVRINTLKNDLAAYTIALENRYSWKLVPTAFSAQGFWVHNAANPVSMTLEHRMGEYYIQDAASMVPPELFDFSGTEEPLLLDMAASPGGKTTHLAERIGDRGFILANDSSRERLNALKIVLQNCGVISAGVTNFHGEYFGAWFPETFDAVLLDAPCSMQNLRASENHPLRPISPREQNALANRQIRLLESGLRALKTGGQLVYSTCTLSPSEDELVIDAILSAYPDAVKVVDCSQRFNAPGLDQIGGRQINPQLRHSLRLWPHRYHTAGFFSALLVKTRPILSDTRIPPSRDIQKAGFVTLGAEECSRVWQALKKQYDLDRDQILSDRRLNLIGFGSRVILVPQRYFEVFMQLPVTYLGLEIGQWADGRLHIKHEFASRFHRQLRKSGLQLNDEDSQRWLSGQDIESGLSLPAWSLPVFDPLGRYLGIARSQDGKARNILPARIKMR